MARRLSESRVKKFSKAQLEKWRSRPGSRSRLPDKYLTAEQRQRRTAALTKKKTDSTPSLENPDDSMELVPESGLTLGDLRKQIAYQEQLNYGDLGNDYRLQQGQLTSNRDRDMQWFDAYRKSITDAQKELETKNAAAAAADQAFITTQRQATDRQDAAVADQLRGDQEKYNLGGPNQAAQYQAASSGAANSRQQILGAMAMAAAERARGGESALGASAQGADLLKSDAMLRYMASQGELGRKQSELEKNKAAFRQKIFDKAVEDAQSNVLERKTYEAALYKTQAQNELAKQKLALDKWYKDQSLANARTALGISQQNANANTTRAAKTGSGGGGGGGKKNRATSTRIQDATSDIGRLLAGSGPFSIRRLQGEVGSRNFGRIRNSLIRKGVSPLLVDTAIDQVAFGGVSPTNRKRLRAAGFKMADFPQLGSKPRRGPNKGR